MDIVAPFYYMVNLGMQSFGNGSQIKALYQNLTQPAALPH